MPANFLICDGDDTELLETEGRVTHYPFLAESVQTPDPYPQQHRYVYEIARTAWQPRLASRTSWTNLFTRAHTPAHADWSKTNLTGTDSVLANPENGLTTAGRILESSATGEHKLTRTPTFTAADHAVDFCAKALGDRWLRLHTHDGTETYEAWFHPTSGAWKYFADVINPTTLNGGFETAGGGGADVFASWSESTAGTSSVTRDTSVKYAGSASCRLEPGASGNIAQIGQGVLNVGRRYRVVFWVRDGGLAGSAVVVQHGGTQTVVLDPGTTFVRQSIEFTALDPNLIFFTSNANAQLWLDDVTLTPLEPAPLVSDVLLNGGFETAGGGGADVFASWSESTAGTSSVTRDTSVKYAGSASCRLEPGASGNIAQIGQSVLRVGRRYRVGFWVRDGGLAGSAVVVQHGGTQTAVLDPGTTFVRQSIEFTALDPNLIFFTSNANAQLWLDDVTLTPLDLPTVTMTALPWPAEGWYRCSFIAPHRSATGTWTLALSSDGTTLSYAGDTAKGVYLWGLGLYAASTLGPIVETLGSTRTVTAPDLDAADPFAYLVAESEPQALAGDLLRVERTFARLPATQTRRDYQTFSRPNPSGRRSSTTYAANVDGDDSFRLWTARKSVLGYQNTPGGTVTNSLPSGNITITLSSGHSATFAANAGQATIQAAVNANIVGVGKLQACNVAWSSSTVTFWLTYYVGGATVSSFSVPSGTTPEQTQSYLRATAFGTTITPDTKLVHCPSHGGAAGELVALWNGHILVARGTVAAVSGSDYLSLVLSDLDSPDFNFSALTLGDDATARYASGSGRINVSIATDYYLPGVSMLSSGSTLASLSDLPAVTTYTSEQRWLDRIVAAATSVPIDATQLETYLGPITSRAVVTALMDDKALELLTLT